MTLGILDPHTYYYRRVYTDAVRAIEAVRSHPAVDATRIAATGTSQGGGLTIAVSGLVPDLAVAMPNVPFLCHFRRAIGLTEEHPYQEIVRFLSVHRDKTEIVFRTLSYFDGMHFAARSQARALYSTALMDMICRPRPCSPRIITSMPPRIFASIPTTTMRGAAAITSWSRCASCRHCGAEWIHTPEGTAVIPGGLCEFRLFTSAPASLRPARPLRVGEGATGRVSAGWITEPFALASSQRSFCALCTSAVATLSQPARLLLPEEVA